MLKLTLFFCKTTTDRERWLYQLPADQRDCKPVCLVQIVLFYFPFGFCVSRLFIQGWFLTIWVFLFAWQSSFSLEVLRWSLKYGATTYFWHKGHIQNHTMPEWPHLRSYAETSFIRCPLTFRFGVFSASLVKFCVSVGLIWFQEVEGIRSFVHIPSLHLVLYRV